MTPEEVREKLYKKLGKPVRVNIGTEYEHVIGFHFRPGEMLCVVKNSGDVLWEDELPDKLVPKGIGKTYILPPEN